MRLITLLFTTLVMLFSVVATAGVDINDGEYVVFYHHDVLGSPVTATNEQGQVIWHERSQPYGKSEGRVSQNGNQFGDNALPAGNSRQGYTGHTLDNSAGLTYMKARYYDHSIGRFLSNDPIGFTPDNPMMFNRYAYASNNPYKYIDPDGKYITTTVKDKNDMLTALATLANESPKYSAMIQDLIKSDLRHHFVIDQKDPENRPAYGADVYVHESKDPTKTRIRTGSLTNVDPNKEGGYDIELVDGTPFNSSGMSTLIHELTHAHQRDRGELDATPVITPNGETYPKAEDEAMENGNMHRLRNNETIRDGY